MSWHPTRAVCGQNILAGASSFWEPDGEAGSWPTSLGRAEGAVLRSLD